MCAANSAGAGSGPGRADELAACDAGILDPGRIVPWHRGGFDYQSGRCEEIRDFQSFLRLFSLLHLSALPTGIARPDAQQAQGS